MKTMTTYEIGKKKAYVKPSFEAVWIDAEALMDVTGSAHGEGWDGPEGQSQGGGAKTIGRTARLSTREQAALAPEFELEEEVEEENISGIFDTEW